MRYWILVLLLVVLFFGCRDKVTDTNDNDNGGGGQQPGSSVPAAPANLHAQAFVGRGILLGWEDRSNNETHFVVEHGMVGVAELERDTLAANTVTFFDSVGLIEGSYHYRVRAVNDSGASAWTTELTTAYRLESNGIIPLRQGNWWEYRADSAGTHTTLRRSVAQFSLMGGEDYYLITQAVDTAAAESLYYARNCPGGLAVRAYPLQNIAPDTLFRYPNMHANDWYVFQEDSIWVLTDASGGTMTIGDSTYHGVVQYQRFLHPGRDSHYSTKYCIVPNRIGIVREIERRGSNTDTLDIVNYHVTN